MKIDKKVLRVARIRKGLLIRELATSAGISPGAARNAVCNGVCGLRTARSIAKALGLALEEFVMDARPDPRAGAEACGSGTTRAA